MTPTSHSHPCGPRAKGRRPGFSEADLSALLLSMELEREGGVSLGGKFSFTWFLRESPAARAGQELLETLLPRVLELGVTSMCHQAQLRTSVLKFRGSASVSPAGHGIVWKGATPSMGPPLPLVPSRGLGWALQGPGPVIARAPALFTHV